MSFTGARTTPPADEASRAGEVVLEVEDLHVGFSSEDGLVNAVRGVSYTVRRGEALGIVGESGAGKSVSSMAVMGLLPKSASITGSARVLGEEMLGLKDAAISRIRGDKVATETSRRGSPGTGRSSCSSWSASPTRRSA
jgi:ABC-type glutathione transport system ATPase component